MITTLLARARGDAADPTLIDLAALLEHEAVTWTRPLAEDGRGLSVKVSPGLVVHARRDHLSGVLSCLLDNALQHGAGGVSVFGRRIGDRIEVEVSDEGSGVPPELAQKVFERRVSGSHGTGIGLALARSLAAAEGGTLTLAGRSSFVLALPMGPANPDPLSVT